MSAAHLIWFATVAIFFSQHILRSRLVDHQRLVDKVIGTVLMGLGVSLAFANMTH